MSFWVGLKHYSERDIYAFEDQAKLFSMRHFKNMQVNRSDKTALLHDMRVMDRYAKQHLREAAVVIVTLGSATYLSHTQTGIPICCAHGMARGDYEFQAMTCDEVLSDLEHIYSCLKKLVSDSFHFVLTLSPQRYDWGPSLNPEKFGKKQGVHRQILGQMDYHVHTFHDKALLRIGIQQFVENHPREPIEYFPSYEIVMEELRGREHFSHDHQDHVHITFPRTPDYVTNRFLYSHSSAEVIDCLKYHREWFYKNKVVRLLTDQTESRIERELKPLISKIKHHYEKTECTWLVTKFLDLLSAHGQKQVADLLSSETIGCATRAEMSKPEWDPIGTVDKLVMDWIEKEARVIVYGAGEHTSFLMRRSMLLKANIVAIADRDPGECAHLFGMPLVAPHEMEAFEPDQVLISSKAFQREIARDLSLFSGLEGKIVSIYPDHLLGDPVL
ncbi:GSCFA domain-containing protein [Sulfidibacter corallicola]